MKIKILKNTVADKGQNVKAGEVVDVIPQTARYLVAVGKAELVVDKPAATVEPTKPAEDAPQAFPHKKKKG